MAPDSKKYTVFVDTSLDTHLATIVSDFDTVSDLKNKILIEHRQCFPTFGDIKIHCLKVKRKGNFYHLSESMLVKSVFSAKKTNWFVSVDASHVDQDVVIQPFDKRKAGDQLALPWVTDSRSIGRHDNHGFAPFVNQKSPNVNQLTSGDSCKDVSMNPDEDKTSSDKQLNSKVLENTHTENNDVKSKKRTRDVDNESLLDGASGSGLSVKKTRKTRKGGGNVKASDEDKVSTFDSDKGINKDDSFEHKSQGKDLTDESTRINQGENCNALDQLAIVVPLEDVGEETYPRKDEELSEAVMPDVVMAVEHNIQQETTSEISQKEKDNELVQKTVMGSQLLSSSITSFGKIKGSEHKVAEKESSSTSFIKKLNNINKSQQDVESIIQESAGDQIDKEKQGPEVKTSERIKRAKKSPKRKDESLVKRAEKKGQDAAAINENEVITKHANSDTCEIVKEGESSLLQDVDKKDGDKVNEKDAQNFDETVVKKAKKNQKPSVTVTPPQDFPSVHQSADHEFESTKSQTVDDNHLREEAPNNITVSEVVKVNNEATGDQIDKEKQGPDVQIPEKRKRAKKSAKKKDESLVKRAEKKGQEAATVNETEVIMKHANSDVCVIVKEGESSLLQDADKKDGDNVNEKDAQIFDERVVKKVKKNQKPLVTVTPQDLPSGHQSADHELESMKSQTVDDNHLPEEASNNITVSEVVKVNNEAAGDHIDKEKQGTEVQIPEKRKRAKKSAKRKDELLVKQAEKKGQEAAAINENEVITKHANGDVCEIVKEGESSLLQDADKKDDEKDAQVFDERVVKKAKNQKPSVTVTPPQDLPSGHQSADHELESTKSQTDDDNHLPEKASNNITVSEVVKVNNEADIPKDKSNKIVFMDYFTPGRQAEKNASTVSGKDGKLSVKEKKTKKKTFKPPHLETTIQSPNIISENENNTSKVPTDAVRDQNKNTDQFETPKKTKKIDPFKTVKSVHESSSSSSLKSFLRSVPNLKSNKHESVLGQTHVETSKKSAPVVKSLLNTSGTIFGKDNDESSADDNAAVNSDSSTRTPSRTSSSSGESDSSLDSRRNGSLAVKRKGGGANSNMNSQSKKMSMTDLLRSSSRFKKAKLTASQVEDTESQQVDFVPESQFIT